jgi:hypothetical protein
VPEEIFLAAVLDITAVIAAIRVVDEFDSIDRDSPEIT